MRRCGRSCRASKLRLPKDASAPPQRSTKSRRRWASNAEIAMSATILITGFGPFPGAPFNPPEPLALALACRRHPAFADVRRVAHVFPVSYEAIDRELPVLLKRERPKGFIMFVLPHA